ncbi:hypothetical protein [Erythrobacter aureus]|nr:hypothetical protein [Erythrobacter aureus]
MYDHDSAPTDNDITLVYVGFAAMVLGLIGYAIAKSNGLIG